MEKIELKIPNLGDAQSTQIIEVNIKPGDEVSLNDPLIVLESEKAAMEVPSDFNGKIKQVFVKQDDEVMEGVIYASIEIEEETVDAPELQKPNKQVDEEYQENKSTQRKNENHSFKGINAGPAVRKYARELEINLNLINGTGNSGRITKDDLKRFIHSNKESDIDSSLPTAEDFSNFGEIEVQKMSKIQKYALTNLTNAWNSIPHVTHFDEADITNINIARKEIGISPLAYIIESVCKNLKKFPKFNSSLLKNNELAIKNYINVGIAVDTPEGLVVPVIKDANMLDVKELDSKVKELAEKALSKKLLTQDYHGATFTISSLGKIGGTGFTPIINPPEVAILGISRSRKALNIQNGQIVERDILPMSLSYDHRVINGADAGKFMESFTNILEETYK